MKKMIMMIFLLFGAILLAGCDQKSLSQVSAPAVTTQHPANDNQESENDKRYSYCKPDEDPDFKLASEDDRYYHYTGDKSIRGALHQQSVDSPITWSTRVNQSCKFELMKHCASTMDIVKNNFDIDDAWENQPDCDPEDGDGYLEGVYTIHVKGFKIPKAYIQQYDPKRIRDKVYMSQFSFYVDYDKIEKVDEKSQIKCPIVVQ